MTQNEEAQMMAVIFDLKFALGNLLDNLPADLPHRDYYEAVFEEAMALPRTHALGQELQDQK